jgi:hypothetical protein
MSAVLVIGLVAFGYLLAFGAIYYVISLGDRHTFSVMGRDRCDRADSRNRGGCHHLRCGGSAHAV